MENYLSTAGVILLESYQLTDATQLGYKPYKGGAILTSLYRWHSARILLAHWCYIARLQTIWR